MTDEKATENVKTQKDYGSEQLPTDAVENPWDVPVQPGIPSPSDQVTGNGEAVS